MLMKRVCGVIWIWMSRSRLADAFKSLQPPVVRWAGTFVHLLHINLGHPCIVLHHGQVRMAQQCLQGKDIAPGAQIRDGEGVITMPSSA